MDKQKLTKKQIFGGLFAGVFVGFVNGFLGAGGGMLVVPILRMVYKQKPKVAHATAVLIILPICVVSSIVYMVNSSVDWNILWQVLIGTLVGGLAGTFLLCKLRNNFIVFLFSLVMIVAGLFMIIAK